MTAMLIIIQGTEPVNDFYDEINSRITNMVFICY